jgi:ferredoxin
MHGLLYLPGVASLRLNRALCVGCGVCLDVCPHAVFEIQSGKALDSARDACMECGACALNCPVGAISVSPGVGCARAIIHGWLTGGEPSCDCGGAGDDCA